MIVVYILMIVIAAFPLVLTIVRMSRQRAIKKHGIHTRAIITAISLVRMYKSPNIDKLTIQYNAIVTGETYTNTIYAKPGKFKVGDRVPVTYMAGKPQKVVMEGGATYWPVLVFCILLFLFVLFAIYKIDEMVKMGSM